ncbi:MAG: macro domain-containing protein [Nitrospinales bacterium]
MEIRVANSEIELTQGDITECDTDAVVNAANSQLILGAGVAGAIRRKGGPAIQEECRAIGHCPVGDAVITTAGRLKAKYVIHAVGPQQGEGGEEEKLRGATRNSLQRAEERHLASIAFPAISTGIFGFPTDAGARIMLATTRDYLSGQTGIQKVVFVLFDRKTHEVFVKTANTLGLE